MYKEKMDSGDRAVQKVDLVVFSSLLSPCRAVSNEEPLGIPDMFLPERLIADDDGPLTIPAMFPPEQAAGDADAPLVMPTMNFSQLTINPKYDGKAEYEQEPLGIPVMTFNRAHS